MGVVPLRCLTSCVPAVWNFNNVFFRACLSTVGRGERKKESVLIAGEMIHGVIGICSCHGVCVFIRPRFGINLSPNHLHLRHFEVMTLDWKDLCAHGHFSFPSVLLTLSIGYRHLRPSLSAMISKRC